MEISKNNLSVFGLIMINIIAICSLRSLPFAALFSWNLIPIYLISGLFFLLPMAYISSFLASRYPEKGGIYVWVRESLGLDWGFLAIWLQWLYNLFWYPSAMVFVVETLLYGFGLTLSKLKVVLISTLLYWCVTLANCFGMRISSLISIIGAIFGTILPMILLIILAASISDLGHFEFYSTKSDIHPILPFIVNVVFGLMGIEMSCVHANDVENPKKSYPKALIISSILIITLLMLSSLSIALLVPNSKLSMINGANQAFDMVLQYAKITGFKPVVMSLMSLGGFACIGAWVIGPSKGLFVAGTNGCLPSYFNKTNKLSVPVRLLVMQAILVSLLSLVFILMPSLEQAYEIISIATSQLALFAYLVLLIAAWNLRNTKLNGYNIPGGIISYKILCMLCMLFTVSIFMLGFNVPPNLNMNIIEYDAMILFGILVLISPVLFKMYFGRK